VTGRSLKEGKVAVQTRYRMATRHQLKGISSAGAGVRFGLLFIAAFYVALSSAAWAQSHEMLLQFSPDQSTVEFTLGATFHSVHGAFNLKSGAIHFNPATGALSGEIVVDAASGRSGNSSRDDRMHQEILESARYPEITFLPDRVEGKVKPKGTSTVQVHGMFGIRGGAHEITVPVQVQINEVRWTTTSHFTIPYVHWGIKNPSNFLLHVKPTVDIEVHASGPMAAAEAAPR
jgi:polyisoprenoid-binding protein YceI